jgi:hypothetical protein
MNGGIISGNTVSASNNVNADRVTANGGGVYTVWNFSKTGGTIYGNYSTDNLGNIAIGGQGHAVYYNVFGGGNNWRNAVSGPNDNSARLDFWLNETDITYSVIHNASPATALVFTFSEDPGNLLASHITLSENVSKWNAVVTGSGTSRTLSPVTISGNGIITVSISSVYRVETGSKDVFIIPDTPTGVTTVATASTVTLNWVPVYLASGYRVYRSTNVSGPYTHIGTASSTSYIDIRLSSNTSYFYKITAFNNAGESVVPAQFSLTTLEANTRQAIAVSSDTIVVEWPRDTSRESALKFLNSSLAPFRFIIGGSPSFSYSYVIYRDEVFVKKIDIPTRFSLLPPSFVLDESLSDHFYVDTDLKPNTAYNYRVTVEVSLDFGILEGLIHKEEKKDVMTASARTLSDVQR